MRAHVRVSSAAHRETRNIGLMHAQAVAVTRTGRNRAHDGLLLLACAVVFAHALYFNHTCDDAYISFRYAYNWAHGHGLVFNRGGFTMGYSNPLWVLLLGLGERLSVPSPVSARLLGALFTFATLGILSLHLRRHCDRALPAFVALFTIACSGVVALWMFGGLEGPLLTFLLARAVLLAIDLPAAAPRRAWLELGACLGLASLTRPEAILYVAPTCAYLGLRSTERARPTSVALILATALSFYVGLTLWQLAYYGDPLPNTYYAKHLPLTGELLGRGMQLTLQYLEAYYWLPLLVCLGFILGRQRLGAKRGTLPLSVIACFVAFYLSIGGDALVYYRMWHVTLPMVALLAAEIIERLQEAAPPRAFAVTALALVLVGGNVPASFRGWNIEYLRSDDYHLRKLQHVAAYMRTLPKDTRIAANVIGILTYGSDLHMVDMLGLTDRHIAKAPGKQVGTPAHESHDARYVLEQKPDLIIPGFPALRSAAAEAMPAPMYPADRDLYARPELRRDYESGYLQICNHGALPVFVRKTYMGLLSEKCDDGAGG